MADLKISQLSDGGNSQATDEYVIARSGANYRIDGASVAAAATSVGTLTSLTVSGDLTVDTSTLKVDSTNNRVGVGTASPVYTLDVQGGRALHTDNSDVYAVGVRNRASLAPNGNYWIGATNAVSPDMVFSNNAGTERLRLTDSGNLGLGVTPSAWSSSFKVLQVRNSSISASDASQFVQIGANCYNDGSWKYIADGPSSNYYQDTGQHVWRVAANGSAGTAITFTQAMTLDASGNLGVGTTSILGRFTVAGGYSYVTDDGTRRLVMGPDGTGTLLGTSTNHYLRFITNDTERARITSGGYFKAADNANYVGSTGPYHELNNSASAEPTAVIRSLASSSPNGVIVRFGAAAPDNNTQYFMLCDDTVATRMYIWSDGDLANHDGVYGTISDERLKQDIVDAGSQWDDLKAVRFRKYRMKTDVEANPDAPYLLGVVAQELEQTSPGLVDEHPDFEEQEVTDEDGNVTTERVQVGTTKSVKSSILLMKAAVALQEAMARIEALEARLEALEA